MKCNICYYNAEPGKWNPKSMEQIIEMYKTLLKVESEPDLVQVTWWEPTLHPQILEILRFLHASKVRHLMLNTNGIKIANDDDFVAELQKIKKWFEVYLQFDSLNDDTLKQIRNRSMIEIREKALEKIEKAGISTTLVCVIQKGLNDNEIPEIIEYAKKWKCVRWVVFQPISDVWRNKTSWDYRITLSEIRQKIIDDKTNEFEVEDMIPLPCDPHKISIWYAMKNIVDWNPIIKPVTWKIPKSFITDTRGTVQYH